MFTIDGDAFIPRLKSWAFCRFHRKSHRKNLLTLTYFGNRSPLL